MSARSHFLSLSPSHTTTHFLYDQMTSLMNNSLQCTNSNTRIHYDNLVLTNDDVAHLKDGGGQREKPGTEQPHYNGKMSIISFIWGRCYFD